MRAAGRRQDVKGKVPNFGNHVLSTGYPGIRRSVAADPVRETVGVRARLEQACCLSLRAESGFLCSNVANVGCPVVRFTARARGSVQDLAAQGLLLVLVQIGKAEAAAKMQSCVDQVGVRQRGRRADLPQASRGNPISVWNAARVCPACGRRTGWTGSCGCKLRQLDTTQRRGWRGGKGSGRGPRLQASRHKTNKNIAIITVTVTIVCRAVPCRPVLFRAVPLRVVPLHTVTWRGVRERATAHGNITGRCSVARERISEQKSTSQHVTPYHITSHHITCHNMDASHHLAFFVGVCVP